jgi:tetratricopeptide (TPR) repeat protein
MSILRTLFTGCVATLLLVPGAGAQQVRSSAAAGVSGSPGIATGMSALASPGLGSLAGGIEDPQADSALRVARRALDAGDYRQAAELFGQVAGKYPRASQAADALYWQAYALYRAGGVSSLTNALASLQDLARLYPTATANKSDAGSLRIRVCGELARRGDSRCAEDVATTAAPPQGQSQSCPGEDDENDERIMALNALMNMNSDAAVPILK